MRKILFLITLIFGCLMVAQAAEEAQTFTVTTTAFLDQAPLPVLYTCDGKNLSPALSWTNAPAKTQSFVILMTDPDAPGGTFYHWIVYNLPSSTKELAEGTDKLPAGTLVGKNSFGRTQYQGPCPPKGSSHSYVLTLYALDTKLKLPEGAAGKMVETQIKNHILMQAQLTAIYSRWLV